MQLIFALLQLVEEYKILKKKPKSEILLNPFSYIFFFNLFYTQSNEIASVPKKNVRKKAIDLIGYVSN